MEVAIHAGNPAPGRHNVALSLVQPALLLQQDEDAYLRDLCGVDSLEEACSLRCIVHSGHTTISHLGAKLPALQELNLTGSTVESIRDLGTGFRVLTVLWVSRCGLSDLDGMSGLPMLRELYAAYNDISELLPLHACSHLEVLDVEGNCIADADALALLPIACPHLQSLSMGGNPMLAAPDFGAQLAALHSSMPSLEEVDVGEPGESSAAAGAGGDARAHGADSHAPMHGGGEASMHAGGVEGEHAGELELVRAGIKHARVGLDSAEFREVEMTLMMDGELPMHTMGEPSILPSSPSSWLRCSQQGSLPSMQHMRSAGSDGLHTPSSTGSPGGSRPASGVAGGLPASQHRLSSGNASARPGTGMRPGTASLLSGRPSTSAPPTAAVAGGLYWRKHRLRAHEDRGGGGAADDDDDDDAESASALTHGDSTAGTLGSVRDLRRRKQRAAGGGTPRPNEPPDATKARSAGGATGGADALLPRVRASVYDSEALLEELRRWKLDTADKALLVPDDEATAGPGAGGWAGGGGPGGAAAPWGGGDAASTSGDGDGGGGEVMDLSRPSPNSPRSCEHSEPLPNMLRLGSGGGGAGGGGADGGRAGAGRAGGDEPCSPRTSMLRRPPSAARPPLSPASSFGRVGSSRGSNGNGGGGGDCHAPGSPGPSLRPGTAQGTAQGTAAGPSPRKAPSELGPLTGPLPSRSSRLTLVKVVRDNSGRTIANTGPGAAYGSGLGGGAAGGQDPLPIKSRPGSGSTDNPLFAPEQHQLPMPPAHVAAAGGVAVRSPLNGGPGGGAGIGSSQITIRPASREVDLRTLNPQPVARPEQPGSLDSSFDI